MSDLCVFTTGHDLDLLRESCEFHGITLQSYESDPWVGYVTGKLRKGIEFLKTRSEPYAMWVDGHDSLVLAPEEEILWRFRRVTLNIGFTLIAGEKNCWPDAHLADVYDRYEKRMSSFRPDSPRLYLNAGGFIGRTDRLMQLMDDVLCNAEDEDDQRAWTKTFLSERWEPMAIDQHRTIFCCEGDGENVVNPCVRHWNGRTPGREEFWKEYRNARHLA